ncbi:MAG: rhomboid family intramembrane serine protease [Polyangiales bacterium]
MISFPRLTSFTKGFIGLLVVAFFVEVIAEGYLGVPISDALSLHVGSLSVLTPAQVALHWLVCPPQALMPRFLDVVFAWWAIPPYEAQRGTKETVLVMVAGVLVSAALGLLVGVPLAAPLLWNGASGIYLAVMGAQTFRHRDQALLVFGQFPTTGRKLLGILAGLVVVMALTTLSVPGFLVASATGLGALAGGVLVVLARSPRPGGGSSGGGRSSGPSLRVVRGGKAEERVLH